MSRASSEALNTHLVANPPLALDTSNYIGVGLRHAHYQDALAGTSSIDFIEVHAENFFAAGGLAPKILEDISDIYPISLHATSMGLGSATAINSDYLTRLENLVRHIDPWLISDHACFTWSQCDWRNGNSTDIHAGDLLPVEFNEQGLAVLADNVNRVQQQMGRPLLIENISSYLTQTNDTMSETDFLLKLVEKTQCGLLIDLNNILVNAQNFGTDTPLSEAKRWLQQLPAHVIGEFHLAGCTPAKQGSLLVDDHAEAVSDDCWSLYEYAVTKFGPKPTLIEWDNNLPEWDVLLEQASKARQIVHSYNESKKG